MVCRTAGPWDFPRYGPLRVRWTIVRPPVAPYRRPDTLCQDPRHLPRESQLGLPAWARAQLKGAASRDYLMVLGTPAESDAAGRSEFLNDLRERFWLL